MLDLRCESRVTSIDCTPRGDWLLVGSSDGALRLYSLVPADAKLWGNEGLMVTQIHAKGLITAFRLNVKVRGARQGAPGVLLVCDQLPCR
jgi:WD40 repeat protein